ncbi:MAG: 2,3,4,5-tetrahydropyridine-2,6-dicarboxylate N-succinyltransferase [Patescibacteria group bacterium]|nr:2,3,4,5-tetrahydropyridine-2,6-dicarboxylate N-succinyltransferase [Patescibacteria group bacterium]
MKDLITALWSKPELLKENQDEHRGLFLDFFKKLSDGSIRTAEYKDGIWNAHPWVIDGIILAIRALEVIPNFALPDNQTKESLGVRNVRKLSGSEVRPGCYIGEHVVLMPSFVNMGAFVGDHTMIDTWATVGSGAYVGSHCHISGGVGIGGMLEPRQEKPVIIEDNCFIGSRCILTEGAHIGTGSVLAANTIITSGTKIFDTRSGTAIECPRLVIPPRVMVIPATYQTKTGLHRPCVEIVKDVDKKVLEKTGINIDLR